MLGIVFATQREAQPLLTRSMAEILTGQPFPLYRIRHGTSTPCLVIISGMGKVAAAMAGTYLIMNSKVTVLISAGLCGCLRLDQSWDVGDILRITHAVEGDCDRLGRVEAPIPCDEKWFRHYPGARLVTCDRPVFDARWRSQLAARADLADMEGTAVARVARRFGGACAMIKGISDIADLDGRQAVADNIDWVSARIAYALMDEMLQITTS